MRKSLKIKMLVVFSVLLLVSCQLISLFVYYSSLDLVKESVGTQASNIVKRAASNIDIDRYEEITIDSEKEGYHNELRKELNTLREANGLSYLYTMSRVKNGEEYDYYYMIDGMPFDSSESTKIGVKEESIDSYPKMKKVFETGNSEYQLTNDEEYGAILAVYAPIKNQAGEVIGLIGADIDASDIYQAMDANKTNSIMITIIILIVGIIIVYFFTDYLTKPLRKLTSQVNQVGKGDLTVAIHTDRVDEVGLLTRTFQQMVSDLKTVIQGINKSSSLLIETSNLLSEKGKKANEVSNQITASIQEVSEGAHTQYKSSEESAATLEQMSKGIYQIAEVSSNVTQLSSISLENAEQGNSSVQKVIDQMNVINHSVQKSATAIKTLENQSNEISLITNMIREISAQTNLLALNAAIEAARAGEHGRGFAIVAEEVRKLAEQSEKSANNISVLISKINEDTSLTVQSMDVVTENVEEGTKAVEEAGKYFESILKSIQGVVCQIEDVSSTSEEMSASSEEITAGVMESTMIANKAAKMTDYVVEQTEEQENYIHDILASITELNKMASELDELVSKFEL